MTYYKSLPLLVAALFTSSVWAGAPTAAALSTEDDYVNAVGGRLRQSDNFMTDRFTFSGTIRARFDRGDLNTYTATPNPSAVSDNHLNADLWFSIRLYDDWRAVLTVGPQLNLKTGKMNGNHDIPMKKLFLEGTVYDKVKARIGRFGAFSSYGRVLDNEVTGAELFFDYQYPTKIGVVRVTKHLNDNPWGANIRRKPLVYAQTMIPITNDIHLGGTAAYLKDLKRKGRAEKNAVFGEIGVDAKFNDDWRWMAAYSRSNVNDVRDSSGKKVTKDGYFTEVRYKLADWNIRNSYDIFLNYRHVGAMSGLSSTNDYSKNVQGVQLGSTYMLWKNLKFQTAYLRGKQVNATAGNKREDVHVFRAQLEYKF